jgi:hypothetical protein
MACRAMRCAAVRCAVLAAELRDSDIVLLVLVIVDFCSGSSNGNRSHRATIPYYKSKGVSKLTKNKQSAVVAGVRRSDSQSCGSACTSKKCDVVEVGEACNIVGSKVVSSSSGLFSSVWGR